MNKIIWILGGGILAYIIIRWLLLKLHNHINAEGMGKEVIEKPRPKFKFSTNPITHKRY